MDNFHIVAEYSSWAVYSNVITTLLTQWTKFLDKLHVPSRLYQQKQKVIVKCFYIFREIFYEFEKMFEICQQYITTVQYKSYFSD